MSVEELFQALDLRKDGSLSREELHEAVKVLGWGWRDAPCLAVLDLLTVGAPLTREAFTGCMEQMIRDPAGPYGQVLLRSPVPWESVSCKTDRKDRTEGTATQDKGTEDLVSMLRQSGTKAAAEAYSAVLGRLEACEQAVIQEKTALLVIDPQRSFTQGAWMQSIGPDAGREVMPIELAFQSCARVLHRIGGSIETVFSRCPFPPDSYGWHDAVADAVSGRQVYFLKPGNSILWPPTNGFRDWVEGLLARGKSRLVIGGCTLNSCVRVSAVEVQRAFAGRGLQVIVDLSLCGGRTSNYIESQEFGGLSSVGAAVREMTSANVQVVPRIAWP